MSKLVVIIAIFALLSCKSSKTAAVQEAPVITMQKTACFGSCPVYKMEIYEDGKVLLEAEKNLPMEGKYKANMDAERLEKLINAFEESNFFDFQASYTAHITDLPTTYISFDHEGKSKKIMDYHGAPEALKALEKEVAVLIDELEWQEVSED